MMKNLLLLSGLFMTAGILYGQAPHNDKCEDAEELFIYASEDEAVLTDGDTRNTTDGAQDNIPVCSANFFRDDVWYLLTAPEDINEAGYAIKVYYGRMATDIPGFGIALYRSCSTDPDNNPFVCLNTPADDFVRVCLQPEETILIRVWSAAGGADNWQEGWGTFRITVFEFEDFESETANILWGDMPGQGDFDGGLNDWTVEGIACGGGAPAENALWSWTNTGLPVYQFGPNTAEIAAIKSRTFCNGAMIFDSGFLHFGTTGQAGSGTCPWDSHEGALISPTIDISAYDVAGVSVLFTQSMQRFVGGRHFIDYSLDDGESWMNIEINTEKSYLSTNPNTGLGYYNEEIRVHLPDAEGAEALRIRFRFQGAAYWWIIDDVRIIELEPHNLRAQSNFFAIQLPIQTVVGQGIPWYPQIDVLNAGGVEQTNAILSCHITDEFDNVVYYETRNLGSIPAATLIENEDTTIPVAVELSGDVGMYTVTYTVESDSATLEMDFDPTDNVVQFDAFVDMNTFALERGPTRSLAPAISNYNDANTPQSYVIGNYFYLPHGSDRKFESITFGLSNFEELAGQNIAIRLYEWVDMNNDAMVQASERMVVAFNEYTVNPADGEIITLDLENFNEPGEPIKLKDETAYLLMVQWDAPGPNARMFVLASEAYDYSAVIFMLGEMGTPHFGPILGLAADGNNEGIDYGTVGFGRDIIPVVRMNTKLLVSAKNTLPDNNIVKLYPNPAIDRITVDLQLDRRYNIVDVYIAGMDGKVIKGQTLFNVQNQIIHLDCSDLASGGYLLYVRTEGGRKLDRFIIQR